MFCSLRRKYQKKEIQFHWNEIHLKEIASSLRFQFSFESNFCCSFCVVVLSFCFSLLQPKKERVIYFLLPSSYFASYLLKKKKKKKGFILLPLRFVISSIYFFQKYFSSQLSCSHPLSYCCSISQQKRKKKEKEKQNQKKKKKNLDASNFSLWRFYSHW